MRAFGEKGTHTAQFLPDGPQVRRDARKGCEVLWGGMVGNAAEASNTAGSGVDGLGAADGSAGGQRRRRDGNGEHGGCDADGRDATLVAALGLTAVRGAMLVGAVGNAGGHGGTGATLMGAADGSAGGLSATLAGAAVRRRWGSRRDGRDGSG